MKQTKNKLMTAGVLLLLWMLALIQTAQGQAFVHPGALSTQADFTRMSNNVAMGAHPWIDDYNQMTASPVASLTWPFNPVSQIIRGINGSDNYAHSQEDAESIYFCALRWRITGDTNYANRAIVGMDAWSSTMTNGVGGNSNFALAAGLCGYEFACAGEELRGYSGWSQASMNAYSNFLMIFYGSCEYYLTGHEGTCDTHYRCNWDACNIAAIISIGVFCDNRAIFNEGIAYYTNGVGNGNIERAVDFVHPDGLGQEEESGRDQAHCMDGINGLSTFCQVAWNQGVDMYGYDNNRYLRALEYVAKCNIYGNSWIPYVHHTLCDMTYDEDTLAGAPIGVAEYFWETPFAHYANIKGISAPFTGAAAAFSRPDGGIYNWNSPDWFGYSTLISYLGPVTNSAPSPSGLVATVSGRQITLNWWGTSLATSYNVKRATTHGGPYTTIAVTGPNALSYVDVGLTSGTTYYYVVSASQPGGETANSAELVTGPNDVISGIVIGSPGAYNNAKRTIVNVFDGSFESFYDALNTTGDWAGIDPGLGVSSVGSVITRIEYAPRKGYATRMVGGQFQGALAGDPNFTNPVTLYTVPTAPTDGFITAQNGVLTSATINNGTAFRYLRYIGPASANCDVSEVVFHGTATGLTAPAAPVNVTGNVTLTTPGYHNELDLSWNASAGATSYTIKRATNSAGPYMILENVSAFKELTAINPITTYADYSVTDGAAYYYVVTALNSAGKTDSIQISAGTPVVGLTATPGNNQVALSWTAASGATSYNVKRGTVSGGPYTTLASPTNTSYTDTTALNGMTYYYVISANQPGGQSANSGEVYVTPTPIIVPNFSFETPVTSSYIYNPSGASWTFSTSSSGVSANGSAFTSGNSSAPLGAQVALLQSISSISQTISGFTPGTSYTITFAASQRQNKSGGQAGQTFNVQIDGVTVGSFEPPQGVSTYQDFSTNFTASATSHTLAFVGTDLNGGDNTAFLDNVRIAPSQPLPAAPTGLSATASNAVVNLHWTQSTSPGITGNNVYRSTNGSGGPYNLLANLGATTSYSDTAVVNGSTYYYSVTAKNAGGESALSAYSGATPSAGITVPNFGFETPVTSTYIYNPSGGSWTFTASTTNGGSGLSANGSAFTSGNSGAPEGAQVAFLQRLGSISQAISGFSSGTTYTVTFAASQRKNFSQAGETFNVQIDGITIGSFEPPQGTSTYQDYTATFTAGAARHTLAFVGTDTHGGDNTVFLDNVRITPTANNGSLPIPWLTSDIGSVGVVGSATYTNPVFTVKGSGADIWGTADAFRYVYQTADTNCSVIARVVTVQNVHAQAKGGVMIRETLNTNSIMAMVDITPSFGVEFIWRSTTGGSAASTVVSGIAPPNWVKVTRSGSTFIGYYSSNGTTWTAMATNTITMANSVYIGLPVCSHVNTTLCTATFDNVTATP